MAILDIRNACKYYREVTAVDNVSLSVPKGSIFGLLGPNGAGKTSLIRMITQITGLDDGEIYIDGELLKPAHTRDIGYMPEERGLYKKMKVGEQLIYLAQLKDVRSRDARPLIEEWMERFEIQSWWNKKVQDLSKGMQQKIQFISTVMHEPKLLILDEPFSGLDPINTTLIREEIFRLVKEKGISVIFSTHRMEQVEEICEHIALINKGKCIVNGEMQMLQQQFKKNLHHIKIAGDIPSELSSDFNLVGREDDGITFQLEGNQTGNDLLSSMMAKGFQIEGYSELLPSMNDIFIEQVEGDSDE